MQTATPTRTPEQPLPRFQFNVLNNPHAIYRTFPQENGHTILGELYADWQTIPDGACVLVELENGSVVQGHFDHASLVNEGDIRLSPERHQSSLFIAFSECVRGVWKPTCYVAGEAFLVSTATA